MTALAATLRGRGLTSAAVSATGLAAAVLFAAWIGWVLSWSAFLAVFFGALFGFVCIVLLTGVLGTTTFLVVLLPWLVVLSDLLPSAAATFTATLIVLGLGVIAVRTTPVHRYPFGLKLGMTLFFLPMVISLVAEGSGEQYIEVAKYALFPAAVLVVTRITIGRETGQVVWAALVSATGALSLHLALGLSGVGKIGTKYGSGELLVYADAHNLALLASCVAAGAIASRLRLPLKMAVFGLAASVTLATGVRSALISLFVLMVGALAWSRSRRVAIVLACVGVGAILWSGVGHVAESRYKESERVGEFARFETAGSGRGEIWRIAVDNYLSSGAGEWIFGTGLRSIPKFERKELGSALVGHSDIVQVGVELGVVGLLGFALIWFALFQGAHGRLPLLALGSFAAVNGSLEYSGPLVLALMLTMAAYAVRRHRSGAVDRHEHAHAAEPRSAPAYSSQPGS
jgi:hypothetical protein